MNAALKEQPHQRFEEELRQMLCTEKQQFGRGGFYQSFPMLNMAGQRPTDERMRIYELESLLTPESDVLDIGCNCGFFALTLASRVASVTGVELNPRLVEIAERTRSYLQIHNAAFIQSAFETWNPGGRQWDLVLSFAVHLWVRMPFEHFAAALHRLVRPGGCLLLESHDIHQNDGCFDQRVQWLCGLGMDLVRWGVIRDDGVHERMFAVLRRWAEGGVV